VQSTAHEHRADSRSEQSRSDEADREGGGPGGCEDPRAGRLRHDAAGRCCRELDPEERRGAGDLVADGETPVFASSPEPGLPGSTGITAPGAAAASSISNIVVVPETSLPTAIIGTPVGESSPWMKLMLSGPRSPAPASPSVSADTAKSRLLR